MKKRAARTESFRPQAHPVRRPVEGAVEGLVEDLVTVAAHLNDTERRLLHALRGPPLAKADLVAALAYRTITGNVRKALDRLDELGLITLTVPEKPRSKNQKHRLTERGKKILATLGPRFENQVEKRLGGAAETSEPAAQGHVAQTRLAGLGAKSRSVMR